MSLPIEQRYQIRTNEIPELSGAEKVVVGSGSERKRGINAGLFTEYGENKLTGICPEKDCGVKESTGINAVVIAAEKSEVISNFLAKQEAHDEIIITGDVVVVVGKPNGEIDGGQYLTKMDRHIDSSHPESLEGAYSQAVTMALGLYSSGPFDAVWRVGSSVRRNTKGLDAKAGIRIKAEMNEIPSEVIRERALRPGALEDNSIVDLISLVPFYAKKVTIRDIASPSQAEVELDREELLLILLVLGCGLPHAIISQLVSEKTPTYHDGTKSINYGEFAKIRPRD